MRYSRQEALIGAGGQRRLAESRVAVLGLGAIGSMAAEVLARSGANLILVDRDVVEESNLQRQLYEEKDIDMPKALALKRRLETVNSTTKIDAMFDDFGPGNAETLLQGADFAIDGFDNLYSRFLLNDACLKLGVSFTYGAAVGSAGLFTLIIPGKTACLRCFIPYSQGQLETCETAGILSPISGTMGMLAAMEAIKCMSGFGEPMGALLSIDLGKNKAIETAFRRKPDCPACAGRYDFLSGTAPRAPVVQLCGPESYYISLPRRIDFSAIKGAQANAHVAHVRLGKQDVTLFAHGRMIVRNASSEKEARSVAEKVLSF